MSYSYDSGQKQQFYTTREVKIIQWNAPTDIFCITAQTLSEKPTVSQACALSCMI